MKRLIYGFLTIFYFSLLLWSESAAQICPASFLLLRALGWSLLYPMSTANDLIIDHQQRRSSQPLGHYRCSQTKLLSAIINTVDYSWLLIHDQTCHNLLLGNHLYLAHLPSLKPVNGYHYKQLHMLDNQVETTIRLLRRTHEVTNLKY